MDSWTSSLVVSEPLIAMLLHARGGAEAVIGRDAEADAGGVEDIYSVP